jgi:glucan 1,3-beta-glucosidase
MQNATANSFDQVLSALTHIQNITNDSDKIHFMVGEAGWPGSGGDDYATAVASTANAQTYFNEAVCPMLAHGIDVFWFEAFDEPGKAGATTNLPNGLQVTLNENFWGAMTSTRDFKLNMTCPETLET